jgi:polyribonucleotide nucleotidyltransferase
MALSAAELQKRHQLEGAPDPFPSLGGGAPAPPRPKSSTPVSASRSNGRDTSEDAFPSLAPSAGKARPALSAWSKAPAIKPSTKKPMAPGGLGRVGHATAGSHPYTESFTIPANELATGKAVTETMKKVHDQTGAVVESSTQMSTGLKQFHIKAADPKRLALARQIIERGLSKPVTLEVEVPISTIGTIIGPKGATLKGITDETGTKIDIPRRDTLPEWDARTAREAREAAGEDYDSDDEPEEPQVSITISGTGAAANEAKAKLLGLISHRISQGSATVKNIPSKYYPFINGPRGANARRLEEEVGEGEVKIHVPPPAVWRAIQDDEDEDAAPKDVSIKVKGDKEKVKAVVAAINRQYEDLVGTLKEFGIVVPKRQHRYLIGEAADDILEKTGCIIDLPPASDPNEQVMMRGPQSGLLKAIELAMSKAEAVAVETVDVVAISRVNTNDPVPHAQKVARFLQRSSRLKQIGNKYDQVKVYAPKHEIMETGKVVIDIVGEKKDEVTKARDDVLAAVKAVPPAAITTVYVDPAVHSLLIGKKGAKIAQFESTHQVTTVFPPSDSDDGDVSVVYNGAELPADKKQRDAKLKEAVSTAAAALEELAKGAADVKTENLDVDKKWHRAIIGQGGTVLNALIGEDQLVNVRVGAKAKGDAEDVVVVRGPSSEVDRVVAQIKQIVEDAKNDDIINGYTQEFDVDKKYVPHLVGQAGSAINKLRETLGVKVNFDDAAEVKKGKKPVAHCKIVGRKEAVEEAKRRIQAQIEKLEDETTEIVKIKREIQPALIGSGGKYAMRLEEKYGVKLSFPRDGKDQKPDEVTIRGGKKGVASAKAELLEAAAFEAESRQSASFTIPQKAVAFIVGKSGATINGIKDETNAQIDIDKNASEDGKTTVTVRGDKAAITAAKAAVLELVKEFGDEINVTLTIDPKYHRTLIGQGGQKLRDLITEAGGPAEAFKQSGLVTFPKQGDDKVDQVRLRGDAKVVKAIQAALEKEVTQLKNTVTRGVAVPSAQHASKIGRGGSALQDLQRRTGATIHFPGSRQYNSVGDIDNKDELSCDEGDIVKVIGTKDAVAKAAEALAQPSPERGAPRGGPRGGDLATRTVSIPAKFYHAIAEQPNLIRQIRGVGAFVTLPNAPPKPTLARGDDAGAKSARIDQAEEEEAYEWEVRENYADAAEGDLDWLLRAKEDDLDRAAAVLERALAAAQAATHVGLLTGLPRSAFPRIIGAKGATISRLRADTGADITVGKDDDLITITGDAESVEQARDAILEIVNRPGRY